jgi:hypothetical protein
LHASVAEPQAKLERDYAAWSNPVREKEREAETKHGKGGHGLTRATKRQIVVDNCQLPPRSFSKVAAAALCKFE